MYVVRFVRYVVTTIGDYYAFLRSRFALCLYGFCQVGLQLLSISSAASDVYKRQEMNGLFRSVRLFSYSVDYGKTPTIQPLEALLQ